MSNITRILSAIEAGEPHAASQLLPLVYGELRKLAAGCPLPLATGRKILETFGRRIRLVV